MRDHNEGFTTFFMEIIHQCNDFFSIYAIEIASWLIREEIGNITGKSARDRNTLLLTTTEFMRESISFATEANLCKDFLGCHSSLQGVELSWEINIFLHSERGDEMKRLKNEGNRFAAPSSTLVFGELSNIFSVNHNSSCVREK